MKQALNDPAPASATYARQAGAITTAPLHGDTRADVIVIGAGITGLSAALHLAQRGRDVVVLEAGSIARGGSGRALGLVLPHHKMGEAELVSRFGDDAGRRLMAGIKEGPHLVKSLIDTHHIACQLDVGGWIMAAHAPGAEAGIRASAAAWRQDSDQVSLLTADEMRAATGSSLYRCGLIDRRALGLNPHAYTSGLARAALTHKVRIHTESRVTALTRHGSHWRATTAHGYAEAPQVVVATDAYTDDLVPAIRRAVLPVRLYQLVSAPLPPDVAAAILPGRAILTDSRRLFGGVRKTEDGRLQISVDGPPTAFSGRAFRDAGTRRIRSLYPDIEAPEWTDEWSGWIAMTRSHLPHVWQVETGLTAAIGMNGRGIAMATLLGRDIALKLTGDEAQCFMPEQPPQSWPVHGALHAAVNAAVRWYRLRDRLDLRQAGHALR